MRELRAACAMLLIALSVLLAGIAEAGDSEPPEGIWRTRERQGDAYGFVEFRKDAIIIDGFDEIAVAYVHENGKLILRSEEFPDVPPTINVIDANTVELTLPGSGDLVVLVRSSGEEMAAILVPPLENILGAWIEERADGENDWRATLEVTKDGLTFNGRWIPGSVESGKGGYSTEIGRIFPLDGGKMKHVLSSGNMPGFETCERSVTYVRSTGEEIRSTVENRGKFLERFFGSWGKIGTPGEGDMGVALKISRERVSYGGESYNYDTVIEEGGVTAIFPTLEGMPVLVLKLSDEDRLSLCDCFGEREREFARLSPDGTEDNTGK